MSSLLVTRKKKSMSVTITCVKHKDWPDGCSHKFTLRAVTVHEETMAGKPLEARRSLALTAVDEVEDAIAQSAAETAAGATVRAVFNSYGKDTGLTKAEGWGFVKEEGVSRATYYRYFDRFVKKKTLVPVPGKPAHFTLATNATEFTLGTDENLAATDALKKQLTDMAAERTLLQATTGRTRPCCVAAPTRRCSPQPGDGSRKTSAGPRVPPRSDGTPLP